MDKQMIIDGVDVSGCKCFYINASHPELQECINPYCKDLCKNNPNCYYKQLIRKEQECNQLKVKYLSLKRGIEIAKEADKYWISQLKAENDLFRTCHDNEQAKRRKFEQTLTEIKEIAEENKETAQYKGICFSILKKISEVIK